MENHAFQNIPIAISELPSVDEVHVEKLHKDYLGVLMLYSTFFSVVILGGGLFLIGINGWWFDISMWLTILGIWAIWTALNFLVTIKGFHQKGYAVRERDVIYQSGWIRHRQIIIPFHRIQHCEWNQGLVERMFGLAELTIYTAGGSSSDLTIPGLLPEDAKRLSNFIIRKSGGKDE